MSQINNDTEFKHALQKLDAAQQRKVAVLFVKHVLPLCNNSRIKRAIEVAEDTSAAENELTEALQSAKAATIECSTRCGADGDWAEQAGYFVARAAVAAITPPDQTIGSPAWHAAMSSRMAQTSILIDNDCDTEPENSENEWQYSTLSDYLKS